MQVRKSALKPIIHDKLAKNFDLRLQQSAATGDDSKVVADDAILSELYKQAKKANSLWSDIRIGVTLSKLSGFANLQAMSGLFEIS